MERKNCTRCNKVKNIEYFYNKYTEKKISKSFGCLKCYYENKEKIPNQQKLYFEKPRDKLLQKQNNRYINYKEFLRSYAELENKLKMTEWNFKVNDSEIN